MTSDGQKTRPLIIGGHIRSGTTLLRNLCHSHPQISMTMEFGSFYGLGLPYTDYARKLLRRVWRRRTQSFLVQGSKETKWRNRLTSYSFVTRYLLAVRRHCQENVDTAVVGRALQSAFPTDSIVGDKVAGYIFSLDELVLQEDLVRVIIYRDCRDVAQSVLARVRTQWRDKPFVKEWDTAEKISVKWVSAIDIMQRHRGKVQIIRYEDFVLEPEPVLNSLGEVLGIDPAAFPSNMIQATSIGKHRDGLSAEQVKTIMDIAGPTMVRLGYVD